MSVTLLVPTLDEEKALPELIEAFDKLKVGDTINVRLTRVLAVNVERL